MNINKETLLNYVKSIVHIEGGLEENTKLRTIEYWPNRNDSKDTDAYKIVIGMYEGYNYVDCLSVWLLHNLETGELIYDGYWTDDENKHAILEDKTELRHKTFYIYDGELEV